MKNIIVIGLLTLSSSVYSQIIIGEGAQRSTDKTSVLLEFTNDNNKGIILPYVKTLPSSPTEGTLLLDVSNPTAAKVKYYNGSWIELSGKEGDVSSILNGQPDVVEVAESKTIIGASSSTADGVLVLESKAKAMVLPIVEDVNNIPSPSPGMIVYVNKTGAKRLAVFNGTTWSFWAP